MYFVYLLASSKTADIYTGMSANPEKRLIDHNMGRVRATRAFRPWRIIYTEMVGSRAKAREREKYLKSGAGREERERLIARLA